MLSHAESSFVQNNSSRVWCCCCWCWCSCVRVHTLHMALQDRKAAVEGSAGPGRTGATKESGSAAPTQAWVVSPTAMSL